MHIFVKLNLYRKGKGESFPKKYTVKAVIGESGSTVCYEATRELKDGIIKIRKFLEQQMVEISNLDLAEMSKVTKNL